jgi:hypothetical protein
MGLGREPGTESMPSLVGDKTVRCCGKLKSCKGFLKRSFESLTNVTNLSIISNRFNHGRHKIEPQRYRDVRVSGFTEWSRAVT